MTLPKYCNNIITLNEYKNACLSHLEWGRGGLSSLRTKWKPPLLVFAARGGLLSCIAIVLHCHLFLAIVVIPPTIHPTSSCSWGWGQVVCCFLFLIVIPFLWPPLSSLLLPLSPSSFHPPLAAFAISPPPHPHSSTLVCHFNPLLILYLSPNPALSLSAPFHLWSTPWAVAHEAGGRWCVVHHLVPFGWASSW